MTTEIRGYDEDLAREIEILNKGLVKVNNASGDARTRVCTLLTLLLS